MYYARGLGNAPHEPTPAMADRPPVVVVIPK